MYAPIIINVEYYYRFNSTATTLTWTQCSALSVLGLMIRMTCCVAFGLDELLATFAITARTTSTYLDIIHIFRNSKRWLTSILPTCQVSKAYNQYIKMENFTYSIGIVDVGGIHITPAKPLSMDLREFVDGALVSIILINLNPNHS